MHKEPELTWLFLDLNSYFASVEQQERPELRGKPVAIVPLRTDSTCAIAASYEAKAYGIKTGTPIYEAKKMCPKLVCVLARPDVYVEYHNRILEEFIKHAPINKVWSIDEISSRLPPGRRTPERAREVAENIKAGLRANIGPAVTASIGIAPNALLGKVAADMKKPDGLTILHPADLPGPLLDLPLTDIPGVGVNMERRLNTAGIHTMRDLWATSPKQARKIWGSVQGERLWYWLHGYDFEPPETGSVMVGHSRILDPHLRRPDQARLMARRLLVKAVYRLRRKGYYAGAFSLGVRVVDGPKWRREIRLPAPARDPFTFLRMLDDLWAEMLFHITSPPPDLSEIFPPPGGGRARVGGRDPLKLKKISVLLLELKRKEEITEDIFARDLSPALHKQESLAAALDRLQNKYQKETVWLGVVPKTLAGHVGTKIAFSRVPETEEFWH